jgi:HEAT repeat protein
MDMMAVFFLAALAVGGVAYVFVYPILSGERKAEQRMASVAKVDTVARVSRGATKSRRDSVEATLAERGMSAVLPLLEAIDGRVYDHGGQTPARALETLAAMREADVIRGLVNVMAGAADDDLKAAAVKALVRSGEPAVPALEDALQDPVARRWVEDALGDIRAAGTEAADDALGGGDTMQGRGDHVG